MDILTYYQNTRSIKRKNYIRENIQSSPYQVIALSETWLDENDVSLNYFDDSFVVHRHDRNLIETQLETGGGCLIAIKRDISAIRLPEWENELPFENVWLAINKKNSRGKIFINVCYIKPRSNVNIYETFFNHISDKVCGECSDSEFIFLGDFNISGISWFFLDNESSAYNIEGKIPSELINTLALTGLNQKNSISNSLGRILDLVLTNKDNILVKRAEPLSKVDDYHPPIEFNIADRNIKFLKAIKSSKLNFFKANYEKINIELSSVDWNSILNTDNINDATEKFYITLNGIIKRNTPQVKPKNQKFPNYFSPRLIEILNDKEYFRKRFNETNDPLFESIYKKKRKEFKNLRKLNERTYLANIENNIQTNTKAFFSYTKSLQKTNKLPCMMKLNGNSSDEPLGIANLFASHFESVYNNSSNNLNINMNCNCLDHISVTETEIINIIKSMDEKKCNSPDNIPSIFYFKTMREIANPLKILFNKSFNTRIFPDKWKESFITPIHKSGDRDNIINYRPISIISTAAKILEKIILNNLSNLTVHLIVPQQHGFMAKKSTVTNLAEFTNFIAKNISRGGQIDTVYTDFAKAFDSVDHEILLKKLQVMGVGNCLISLIKSYLVNRSQYVTINGVKSKKIIPISSVPQGSCIAALLFAIFINDLIPLLKCETLLLADDLKIFTNIKSYNDGIALQEDLNTLNNWCTTNKLKLNANKCVVISFTRKNDQRTTLYNYRINNIELRRETVVRDLGILMDEKFTFASHIDSITKRSYRMLGFICKTLHKFQNLNSYFLLYNAYVRSSLEYASTIWNPHYNVYINQIEKVQKRFTRIIGRKFHFPREDYHLRLIRFDMISLKNRRLISDELFLCKMVNGSLNTKLKNDLTFHQPTRTLRNHPIFYVPFATTNIEYSISLLRIQRQHNDLFRTIDMSVPIGIIKRSIINLLPTVDDSV